MHNALTNSFRNDIRSVGYASPNEGVDAGPEKPRWELCRWVRTSSGIVCESGSHGNAIWIGRRNRGRQIFRSTFTPVGSILVSGSFFYFQKYLFLKYLDFMICCRIINCVTIRYNRFLIVVVWKAKKWNSEHRVHICLEIMLTMLVVKVDRSATRDT